MNEIQEIAVRQHIEAQCDKVKQLLLEKNAKYGNSALEPLRIFSKAGAIDGIRVRIDDKLCRIANGNTGGDEDTVLDLIGYLVLYRIGLEMGIE